MPLRYDRLALHAAPRRDDPQTRDARRLLALAESIDATSATGRLALPYSRHCNCKRSGTLSSRTKSSEVALNFHPRPGTVLICDFAGFQIPEIVKRRRVVVVSPRRRRLALAATTVIVVPLSTTAPDLSEGWHVQISARPGLVDCWAKGDMITHVRLARLDRIRHDDMWIAPILNVEELRAVRHGVRLAIQD